MKNSDSYDYDYVCDMEDQNHPPSSSMVIDAVAGSSSSSSYHRSHPRKKRTTMMTMLHDDNNNNNNNNIVKANKYGGGKKQAEAGAPKITPPCTECGKKFWSWKALFGHMRCHPERQWRGINPPPNITPRQPQMFTDEDHEVAASLLLLAKGKGKVVVKEDTMINVNYGILSPNLSLVSSQEERFVCSSCKKVFGSHQALGGHRASHKNVKGCFAINVGEDHVNIIHSNHSNSHSGGGATTSNNDNDQQQQQHHMDGEGHKCSICLRVFSTGQALGGHKRCHWENKPPPNNVLALPLDLNFPPREQEQPSLNLDLRLRL